jgi:hypothetical protein
VIIYDHGKPLWLSADKPAVQGLVALAEERLHSADNLLRLAVTPGLITGIQQSELVIEFRYARPHTLEIPFRKKTITLERLLIPLTGDFAEGVTTIFLGYPEYAAGPYRSKGTPDQLRKLAEELRSGRDMQGTP